MMSSKSELKAFLKGYDQACQGGEPSGSARRPISPAAIEEERIRLQQLNVIDSILDAAKTQFYLLSEAESEAGRRAEEEWDKLAERVRVLSDGIASLDAGSSEAANRQVEMNSKIRELRRRVEEKAKAHREVPQVSSNQAQFEKLDRDIRRRR